LIFSQEGLPADFWSLMPQQLIILPVDHSPSFVEALELAEESAEDVCRFVLETGSMPPYFLSSFAVTAGTKGAISLLYKER